MAHFAATVLRRHAFLCTFMALCSLISLAGYCWDGSVPLLGIGPRGGRRDVIAGESAVGGTYLHSQCPPNTSSANPKSNGTSSPFVAPGPSHLQELIPMDVLMQKVSMKERRGLALLDHLSLHRYHECEPAKLLLLNREGSEDERCTQMSFQSPDHPIVALTSFHGSGNTWVRHLLEQATGIYSGAVYCDPSLKAMFPGEGIVSGSVIVVKTHQSDSTKLPVAVQVATGKESFDKVILLVRDPFDALVSEANRRWNERPSLNRHVGLASESDFLSSKWDWFVEFKGISWSFALHTWLSQSQIPVHVVQYEKLVSDVRRELEKMLVFLGYHVSNTTMDCVTANSSGKFKRTDHLNFNPFSTENRALVNRIIRQAAPLLAQHGIKYNTR